MRKYLHKIRYIRHPYLIWRTATGYYEHAFNKSSRVNEYKNYTYSIEDGLQILLGTDANLIRTYIDNFEHQCRQRLNEAKQLLAGFDTGMPYNDLVVLYVLCRIYRPIVVVETGCASGFSSTSILQALADNGIGELYSIDLHHRDEVVVPTGKDLGWVIPPNLRDRWHLMLGESFKVLPPLLNKLKTIDIFLHDSRHTYRTMMKEWTIVWPHLHDACLLLSHDITSNDAFLDFCDKVHRIPSIIGCIGIIIK